MITIPPISSVPIADSGKPESGGEGQKTGENIEAVLDFYARESRKISRAQRILEHICRVNGQPAFLAGTMLFVALWIGANSILERVNLQAFDAFPYHLLHGIISLGALLTATVLLIKQERLGKLAEQREHLDLTVTLLTEQKAAKLIELIEELRRDLPNVRDRLDSGAAQLKQPMNPGLVLAALAEPLGAEARSNDEAATSEPASDKA